MIFTHKFCQRANLTNCTHTLKTIHTSIVGKNKPENQDSFLVDEEEGVFIIADGMSGWNGKKASNTAINTILKSLKVSLNSHLNSDQIIAALKQSLIEADREIRALQGRSGSTVDVGIIRNGTFHLAHIGDSRVYLLYKNLYFEQATKDMAKPQSSYHGREPHNEREKKILALTNSFMPSKWLGDHDSDHEKISQFEHISLLEVKRILMTTDGLTDLALDSEIREALLIENLEDTADKLLSYIEHPHKVSETFVTHLDFFLENHLKEKSILSMLDPIFNKFRKDSTMRRIRNHYKSITIPDEGCREFILGYFKKFPEIKASFLSYINGILNFRDDTTFIIIEL